MTESERLQQSSRILTNTAVLLQELKAKKGSDRAIARDEAVRFVLALLGNITSSMEAPPEAAPTAEAGA